MTKHTRKVARILWGWNIKQGVEEWWGRVVGQPEKRLAWFQEPSMILYLLQLIRQCFRDLHSTTVRSDLHSRKRTAGVVEEG